VTVRPTRTYRWGASLFLIAAGGALLGIGVRDALLNASNAVWGTAPLAALLFGFAVLLWSACIEVDDSSVTLRVGLAQRYERSNVAGLRIGRFEIHYYTGSGRRYVSFLRADGSTLFTTYYRWWGRTQLEALATYLGVPIER
jgi:hypothetical protein